MFEDYRHPIPKSRLKTIKIQDRKREISNGFPVPQDEEF